MTAGEKPSLMQHCAKYVTVHSLHGALHCMLCIVHIGLLQDVISEPIGTCRLTTIVICTAVLTSYYRQGIPGAWLKRTTSLRISLNVNL